MPKLFADYPLVGTLADTDRVAVGTGGGGANVGNIAFADLAVEMGRQFPSQNKDTTTFAIGAPLATHSSGIGVVRASAADNSKHAVGLARLGEVVGALESVQRDGVFHLDDWTAITGSVTLAARASYFLDATAGRLSNNPPTGTGQVVQVIGRAVSANDLELLIGDGLLL